LQAKYSERPVGAPDPVPQCWEDYCDGEEVTEANWKKCYRKAAMLAHPDRGGSVVPYDPNDPTSNKYEFKRVNNCNEQVKKRYEWQ
jgi:hypothetical protein